MGESQAAAAGEPCGGAMPLAGVRILEFSGLGPTPFGAMLLADLGADIIRITRAGEGNPLGGDERFNFIFRGRPSIALDLKASADLELVFNLVRRADIVIEGFRPGTMERLGLGPEIAGQLNEQLIYVRMSGWGQDGPLAHKAGHDINYLAMSGGLFPLGPFDAPPVPPLNLIGNFGGGGTFLAIGVLAAMFERERSGRGQTIDVAMIDGISVILTQLAGWIQMGQWNARRGGNLLDGSAYFYRCYSTADGRHIAVGALEKSFHDAFVAGLGLRPDDFEDHLNPNHWPGRSMAIERIIKSKTMNEWENEFSTRDACVTPVLSIEEAMSGGRGEGSRSSAVTPISFQPAPAPRFSRSPTREVTQTVGDGDIQAMLELWGFSNSKASGTTI